MERRLAAIVSTDIVGYSRLLGADEAGTLARMKAHRVELWSPVIDKHGGRVVGTGGDSLLVEFSSAVSAVESSIEVQQRMAEREAAQPDDRKMLLRIGINIGEVVVDGDDIFGDGVNVAARLQALAEPGGILVSAKVHDEIDGKVAADFADEGEHTVKNIARPIGAWRWVASDAMSGDSRAASTATAPLPLPDKPSIAVLPFDNMSSDPGQEYLSDGITEDIITALSKFRWFFVTARNSTFAYKGQSPDVRQVARELGVRYVMEGSVRKSGDRVRVTGQLIDSTNGNHLWAERYDREIEDIFALQDDITAAIVGAVGHELAGAERARATQKAPESLDSWDLYQRAMWHMYRYTGEDSAKSQDLFERAITADPRFAAAHAGLALNYHLQVIMGWSDAPSDVLAAGLTSAVTATELDDMDPLGHCALGRMNMMRGDFETAIDNCQRAVALNPNFANAIHALGAALLWAGKPEEAIPHFDMALRLSPNDPNRWAIENLKGAALWFSGRYEDGIVSARKASRHPSADFWPHANLACLLAGLDRVEEAKAELAKALEKRPDLTITAVSGFLGAVRAERKAEYLGYLRKAGLPE